MDSNKLTQALVRLEIMQRDDIPKVNALQALLASHEGRAFFEALRGYSLRLSAFADYGDPAPTSFFTDIQKSVATIRDHLFTVTQAAVSASVAEEKLSETEAAEVPEIEQACLAIQAFYDDNLKQMVREIGGDPDKFKKADGSFDRRLAELFIEVAQKHDGKISLSVSITFDLRLLNGLDEKLISLGVHKEWLEQIKQRGVINASFDADNVLAFSKLDNTVLSISKLF